MPIFLAKNQPPPTFRHSIHVNNDDDEEEEENSFNELKNEFFNQKISKIRIENKKEHRHVNFNKKKIF